MKYLFKILVVSLILNCLFVSSLFAITFYERVDVIRDKNMSMFFNGHQLNLTDTVTGERYYPLVYNDRTYIPVRAFLNVVGVDVDWDEDNNAVLFETKYNIQTGEKEKRIGTRYKTDLYQFIEELNDEKNDTIETVYYEVDKEFIKVPKVENIVLSNRENVLEGTILKGASKELLREYVFISEPMIFIEKVNNNGNSLDLFYEKLRVVLKENGFSLISEIGNELKFIKSDMNLYVIRNNDNITLKIIKGTLIER